MGNNKKRARMLAQIVAGVLVLAMLIGATYAWSDYSQHKTNTLAGELPLYNVTLNDEFTPNDHWSVDVNGGVEKKVVSVTNPLAENKGDVYVRIAVKEYMSFTPALYTYSDVRYATEPDPTNNGVGQFLVYQDEASAQAAMTALGYAGAPVDYTLAGYGAALPLGEQNGWYLPTSYTDVNGQYGKFLVLSAGPDTAKPVVYGNPDAQPSSDQNVANGMGIIQSNGKGAGDEGALAENSWALMNWAAPNNDYLNSGEYVNGGPVILNNTYGAGPITDIREFVAPQLGDIIPYSTWYNWYVELGNPDPGVWVYNDLSTIDPYIYWSKPLQPGQTTADLVKSLTLLKQPDGYFNYEMFVDMEAVSKLQMAEHWGTTDDNGILAMYDVKAAAPTPTPTESPTEPPTEDQETVHIDKNMPDGFTINTFINIPPTNFQQVTLSLNLGNGTTSDLQIGPRTNSANQLLVTLNGVDTDVPLNFDNQYKFIVKCHPEGYVDYYVINNLNPYGVFYIGTDGSSTDKLFDDITAADKTFSLKKLVGGDNVDILYTVVVPGITTTVEDETIGWPPEGWQPGDPRP